MIWTTTLVKVRIPCRGVCLICVLSPSFKETLGKDHEVRSYNFSKKKTCLKKILKIHFNIREKHVKVYYGCLASPRQLHQFHSCAQFHSRRLFLDVKQMTPTLSIVLSPFVSCFWLCFVFVFMSPPFPPTAVPL